MHTSTSRRSRRPRAPIAAAIGLVAVVAATMVAVTSAQAATVRYEAENSPATCEGTIDSNHSGYSGSGFCNTTNATGAQAQFTIESSTAGTATIEIRYANGAATGRPADILVNGSTAHSAAAFAPTSAWDTWSTTTVTVAVGTGANTISLVATTADGLGNIDYADAEVTGGMTQERFEAESPSAACDGTIDSNWSGYSGTGFCNTTNTTGAGAQFTIDDASAGTATIGIRYAHGGADSRATDIVVNGSTVQSASAFSPTGAWDTWSTKTATVQLNSGSNTISLAATTSGGLPNIDYIEVTDGEAPSQPGNGSLTDPNVHFYGRWDSRSTSFHTMGWAGAYVETRFTGSSIGVRLRNTIDMYYSIDGGAETWMRNVSGNVTVRSGLGSGTHTVRIGFRERAGSYNGDPSFGGFILASGGQTSSAARPGHHIEFVGDSITVGQPNGNRPFTAYPWVASEALGASHMQVAEGGACVSTTDCRGMVDWFLRTGNQDSGLMWDFSTYETDVVVINLGTNNKVSAAQFQTDYIRLLERARQSYPNAEILAMGVFRGRLIQEVKNAVANRNDAGDAKVHFVDTDGWITAGDTHDNVHPTDAGHAKIANRLAPIIGQYL